MKVQKIVLSSFLLFVLGAGAQAFASSGGTRSAQAVTRSVPRSLIMPASIWGVRLSNVAPGKSSGPLSRSDRFHDRNRDSRHYSLTGRSSTRRESTGVRAGPADHYLARRRRDFERAEPAAPGGDALGGGHG